MNLRLDGKQVQFRQQRFHSSPTRIFMLVTLLIGGLFLMKTIRSGAVRPLFDPTPTPTRISTNYALEGQTHFLAGNLPKAIEAYKLALSQDPKNIQLWSELARIQSYSSNLLSTDDEKFNRMKEALESATQATTLAPDNSNAHAVRAFVLDWYASTALAESQRPKLLTEAEQEAERALTLDNKNALAMAYNAEILVDNLRWTQAEGYIKQAMELDKSNMDIYRVYAYVEESLGNYNDSITAYKQAAEIMPNLTFLYNAIAKTYRHLRQYEQALSYYAQAVAINQNLGIKDPNPYLGIAKTYTQTGDFFAASLNVRKALQYDPANPDVYAQLGIVYWHARNYEGSIPAFRCALSGCNATVSCEVRKCDPAIDPQVTIEGMPLTGSTVVYYYTFGSVLAAMHTRGDDMCTEADKILAIVRERYSSDAGIMSIVDTGDQICRSYGISSSGGETSSPTPEGGSPSTATPAGGAASSTTPPAGNLPTPTSTPRPSASPTIKPTQTSPTLYTPTP